MKEGRKGRKRKGEKKGGRTYDIRREERKGVEDGRTERRKDGRTEGHKDGRT